MVFGNEDLDAFKAKLNVFVRTRGQVGSQWTQCARAACCCHVGLALLAACAEAPPRSGESAPDAVKASPAEAAIVSAIAAHRQQAERDAAGGDLAAAAREWQVLTLLAPDDARFRAQLDTTRAAIEKGIREQLQAGNSALRAGDADRATRRHAEGAGARSRQRGSSESAARHRPAEARAHPEQPRRARRPGGDCRKRPVRDRHGGARRRANPTTSISASRYSAPATSTAV